MVGLRFLSRPIGDGWRLFEAHHMTWLALINRLTQFAMSAFRISKVNRRFLKEMAWWVIPRWLTLVAIYFTLVYLY